MNSENEFLSLLGWSDFFKSQNSNSESSSLVPARVICEERSLYRVQVGLKNILSASVSGKFQHQASLREDFPAVGDWVMIEVPQGAERGVIHEICPRKTMLYRKQIGSNGDKQILSTNVDFVFITTSANDDLKFRRIERYLTIVEDSGAKPIILLTKADVCLDKIAKIVSDTQRAFVGVDVQSLSQDDFAGAQFLKEYLKPGTTSVFIGSSGVGKSTLVNFLIGSNEIKTQEIREDDSKGKHTTTSRNLYLSRYGGLVIDTPGMRELQLSEHQEGLETQFSEITELISQCRFNDCKHQAEPGCAVLKSLKAGELLDERWKSYQKLEAEIRHALRKQDKALASEDKKAWKKISVQAREAGKKRNR